MKKKKTPEQKLSGPRRISKEVFCASMVRLLENDDFQLLRGRWLDLRSTILEGGKSKPSEGQWNVLKGFDLAIMEPEKWAERRELGNQEMADELEAKLGEGR